MNDARTALPRTLRVIDQGMADGLHEDLGIGVSTNESAPRLFGGLDASLQGHDRKS